VDDRSLRGLLEEMTLKEKIGQLSQISGESYASKDTKITGPMAELGMPEELIPIAGSILGASGAKNIKSIQDNYLEKNRLKIPLLFMSDIIHGFKTIFPIPLAIGSSWDTQLAKESAQISAIEAAVSGVHVTFSPMVDLVRDPRWGRVMETTGEDKYLNERFAEAFVEGYQKNNDFTDQYSIVACVKHFAGYGASEAGRDYNTVNMSERQLREDYLSGYQVALNAGAEMMMTSFNTIDGIPATGNKWLMESVLRNEWGFDGVLITDWGSLGELIPHGVAKDEKEAALKGIEATVDIEMMTFNYIKELQNLVEEGTVSLKLIDEAVMRILRLKNKLGLFENPYREADEQLEKELIFSANHRKKALEVAEDSMVLLKNDNNILPLLPNKNKIAVIGPFAKDENILGAWSWQGEPESASQLLDEMSKEQSSNNILYAKGSGITKTSEEEITEAIQIAKQVDVIVLALGEDWQMSGEAASRTNIKLPEAQLQLVKRLKEINKPIVTMLFNGRPLDLNGIDQESDAILEAWFPGTEGGKAVSNILFGKTNPSGKLAMSFPVNVGQVPVYYNQFNTGRPKENSPEEKYVSKYLDAPNAPKYVFGYGQSYTKFKFSELTLSKETFTKEEDLTVSITVTNIGNRTGKEVVQLYIRDLVGEVVRPIKELKDFIKIQLDPGESKDITFTVREEMLRYYHPDMTRRSDPGEFQVFVGNSSSVKEGKIFKLVD
jgi:beta-glucosidase